MMWPFSRSSIDGRKYVVKAQIAAGGRGLAGGVKFAATPTSVHDEAKKMLGARLVTEQTGPAGEIVYDIPCGDRRAASTQQQDPDGRLGHD